MDIDQIALRRSFEEWAIEKGYPRELWPILWEAYMKGVYDAPGPYDIADLG
jgi:hypothetical protein